jgi:hypothetical protein
MEDRQSGSDILDSVLLRIMIQPDNCICPVTIDNQLELVYIGLGRYDNSRLMNVDLQLTYIIYLICLQEM